MRPFKRGDHVFAHKSDKIRTRPLMSKLNFCPACGRYMNAVYQGGKMTHFHCQPCGVVLYETVGGHDDTQAPPEERDL